MHIFLSLGDSGGGSAAVISARMSERLSPRRSPSQVRHYSLVFIEPVICNIEFLLDGCFCICQHLEAQDISAEQKLNLNYRAIRQSPFIQIRFYWKILL